MSTSGSLELKGDKGDTGLKGDPGGFNTGTDLLASNLNDILTPGLYRQASTASATLLNNYPLESQVGVLTVTQQNAGATGGTHQMFSPSWGRDGRVLYQRTKFNGSWTAWRTTVSTRWDYTAGRAAYAWDDGNNREQLVYGDTGWRQMTPDPATVTTDNGIQLRRTGYLIHLRIIDTYFTTAASTTPVLFLPEGFRAQYYKNPILEHASNPTNPPYVHARLAPSYDATNPHAMYVMQAARNNLTATTRVSGEISWLAYESWPTVLPGTASGSIPNL